MTKKTQIAVKQDVANPVTIEVLATSIRDISKAMKEVNTGGLNRRALLLLLSGATHLAMKDIDYVLNALSQLEELYLVRKPGTKK